MTVTRNNYETGERLCSGCDTSRPFSEFFNSRHGKACGRCRACIYAARKQNPEAQLTSSRRWRERNPDKVRDAKWRAALRKHGLTASKYEWLLARQGGVCAVCPRTEANEKGHRLYIDHDHRTGEVRGLLCGACNPGIGFFQDSPALLRRAAEYLEAAS